MNERERALTSTEQLLAKLAEAEASLNADNNTAALGSIPDGLVELLHATRDRLSALQQDLIAARTVLSGTRNAPIEGSPAAELVELEGDREADPECPPGDASEAHDYARYAGTTLTALIETLPVGIIIADASGRLIKTNSIGTEMLSGPVRGTIDKPQRAYQPFHIDGSPFLPGDMPLARALATGEHVEETEILLRFDDGNEVYLSAAAVPLLEGENVIVGGVTVFRDITQRKLREVERQRLLDEIQGERLRAEALARALRQERDILDAIMENTATQLAYLDPSFNFVRVNAAYARGSGIPRAQLIGSNHFDLFPDEENEAIFRQVRDTGEPVVFNAKPFVYAGDPGRGVTYWDWTLVPVRDEDGKTRGLVFSLLDVTDRVRAEAEIVSLARFPSENPHPVLRVTEDGTVIYANAGSAAVLSSWRTKAGDKVPLRWQAHIREAIRSQRTSTAEIRAEGTIFAVTVAPSQEGYANLYGLDITELRRTQRALRQYANRLRALHQTDQAILAAESTEAIAEAALAQLPQMIYCVRASVALFDFETDEYWLLAVYTVQEETRIGKGWRAPLAYEWPAHIDELRRGEAVVISDVQELAEARISPLMNALQYEGIRALIRQPLRARGELIGTLDLGLPRPGPVASHLTDLARELADQLAIAIQQARLHRQVQDYAAQLERRVVWRTAALRISEARFRAIFEDAPMGIALLDAEGRIIQTNPALERILGEAPAVLHAKTLRSYMSEADAEHDRQRYQALMKKSHEPYQIETRLIRTAGQATWCNLTISLVKDIEEQPRLAICIVEDISARREAQVAMVQTEKLALTGQLAASLAHEINNPLQTVIGCLGLAEEARDDDVSLTTYLQMASQELRRAAGIVGRLRDLNRPSAPEEKQPGDLRQPVQHILTVVGKQCRDHGISVEFEVVGDNLPHVLMVPDRIHQVFLNVVLNAIDAMPHGGTLHVTMTRTGGPDGASDVLGGAEGHPHEPAGEPAGVRVTFQDTGVGIPPEIQARLFDPFQTTKPEGLGLGLYISQSIIEDHQGTIEIESQPGEGTTFTIWLPAHA